MRRREIETITKNEVLDIHNRILKETGGESGILNLGNIEFTIDFIETNAYVESRMDLFDLVSVLVRDIIQGHPFMDGNKRTGMESLDVILTKNGFELAFPTVEGIRFSLDVAMGLMDLKEIKAWIISRSEKRLYKRDGVREGKVSFMTDENSKKKRENPYNISEESMAIIDESIKRNKKFLQELAKY